MTRGGGGGGGGHGHTIPTPSPFPDPPSGGWGSGPIPGDWNTPPPGGGSHGAGGDHSQNPGPMPPGGGTSGGNQSVYDAIAAILSDYGLDSLLGELRDMLRNGITDQASIMLHLQDTKAWKQRFAGNEMLRNQGLAVLSPAEYLATERAYAQVMQQYGLPRGFYDDPTDFANFIGHNVSASELQQRVSMYADLANRDDAATKEQLRAMGFSDGDLLAWMIDPTRATPLLQQRYQETLIGAAARRTGLVATNAADLAKLGITEQQATQGFGIISQGLNTAERLGAIYGSDFTQADFENEVFKGDGAAATKRKKLASRERASFSGSSGIVQGSQERNASGSY